MDGVDLNLNNYSLDDLLSLFELNVNFTGQDLKQARKIVARVHPDKSSLPGTYFEFFNRAYNLLEEVHNSQTTREDAEQRCARGPRPEEMEYQSEIDKGMAATLGQYSKKPGFNQTFNQLFEKHATLSHESDQGYGDWLSNTTDQAAQEGSREEVFSRCKREARALIRVDDIQPMSFGDTLGHSELVSSDSGGFGASSSSSLPYQDLRQAHEMSVIPVTEEDDFQQKQRYSGVGQLKQERERMDRNVSLPSLQESRGLLEKRERDERTESAHRAFTLAQQREQSREANSQMLTSMLRLTTNTRD